MPLPFVLLAGLVVPTPPRPAHLIRPAHEDDVTVTVTVDSSHHVVHIKAGPFYLPNMPKMDHHMMDMMAGGMTQVYHFTWPVEGWMRGFRSQVEDAHGKLLPKHLMHHMIGLNFSRRQLIYPAVERLFGSGAETADVTIPATIGVPMKPGMDLGFYIMWHNDTGADLDSVYMTADLLYSPKNQNPRPVEVLPLYMDCNLTVGGSNAFDVPPGWSEKSYEFTFPIDGHLLGYGGHLHDYGVSVSLIDVESGKVVAKVTSDHDKDGKVSGVSRSLPGVRGAGVKLAAGRRYRVVGVYDNLTSDTLHNGAMAHITGIFAPDDLSQWPKIDDTDPLYQRDLASLEAQGMDDSGDMSHMHMDHDHMDMGHSQMQHDR
ncbi:MAG TPA: hypothetical protein VMG41_16805 [Gemmatimonadales bacterium]|nr:hypothetical protein [Gemmatimonadales bacterium]